MRHDPELLAAALRLLLTTVENAVDWGIPFEDANHGWHEPVMKARAALAAISEVTL